MENLLDTDLTSGLSQEEAQTRIASLGENTIKTKKRDSVFIIFLKQFKDFMIILLLIAATFSFAVAISDHVVGNLKTKGEIAVAYIEPFIILLVVALNSMLGTYQEIKSDQAVQALAKSNELYAKVIRDGKMVSIPSSQVTLGDLIVIEAGDMIPADAQLVEAFSLSVVESAITGEALAVDKKVGEIPNIEQLPLGDRYNTLFSGTYCVAGRGIAIVTAIGKNTEVGKINSSIQEQKMPKTPLQIKLDKLSKIFGIAGVILLFVTTILQIVLTGAFSHNWAEAKLYSEAFKIGISLAVAAIPEGLITFTTVLLAIGVARMTKENAIIKAFPAVESLGSASVICTDKTGTLTENKMTVVKFYDASGHNNELNKSQALGSFVACCDAEVTIDESGNYVEVGDPTETAILRFGLQQGNSKQEFYSKFKKLSSLPFDSDRKMMSVLIKAPNGAHILITKGAPDVIFSRCDNLPQKVIEKNEQWANGAMRVIAVAYKILPNDKYEIANSDENNLTFSGLVGLIDPPRDSVKASIQETREAGIKTVMITGDHLTTAVAIARSLDIYREGDKAIDGIALAQMSDEELAAQVEKISVYARVNPSDKLRIVKAWQSHDKVVAMTGDGVNDAPALKAAEVGCAMGITGTDVSKQAADVILTDDNFNTIVRAIKSGRETFIRIKTVILNLLVSSLTEIIVMLVGLFLFRFIFKDQINSAEFIVLTAAQLLWINLLTHGLPAIALGMIPSDVDVMHQKPINKRQSLFANGLGKRLIIHSAILSFAALSSYLIVGLYAKSQDINGKNFVELTSSATFITLGIGSSINSLNLMSTNSIFKCSFKKYKLVYLASAFSLVCMILTAFIPGINQLFGNIDIMTFDKFYSPVYWLVPILLGFILMICVEFYKLHNHLQAKKKNVQDTNIVNALPESE
ncbi:cation-translocating P-type ATPase [Mycoplasmopsis verecunda]|uniref:Ca2+-transporting ATPase n=1 Tax=Mycoplasmopsis verecunda TaxID=171291 RepID=A0A1T4L699_9BACT|nr:cation-translocating P-type ATPase [Mycoplasmopsis verecunda]WPB54784.1 cation-translocating P-type ATPase [Mycoplasmopsis verecunda]SJZ50235.1 Ca2+-transporting ATPase [Mycoplasmopsis verecunda]